MRRLIFAVLLFLPVSAFAKCPSSITDCPSPSYNSVTTSSLTVSGTANFNGNGTADPLTVLSRNLSTHFQDTINVKDSPYSAQGDTVGFSDGTISASGTTLTSNSATFTNNDVGKSIVLSGSGASDVPQQGTITGFNSTHSVNVSFTASQATPWSGSWSASVANQGSGGYTNGDTLTLSGGSCTTQPSFTATVNGGNITALATANGGHCTSLPGNPVSVTGGTGTGATLTITGFQQGGRFSYGTDDTTSVTNAITAAKNAGKCAYFPQGGYFLASQTTSIPLTNTCILGTGTTHNFFPFTGGALVYIANSSTAAFSGIAGTTMYNMSFYYPGIDNTQSTPIVYPALFQVDSASGGSVNNWFIGNRVLNAYQVFHVTTSGSLARSTIAHNMFYGVDAGIYMQNGFADIVELTGNYWGVGSFGALATGGPANLQQYSVTSGSVFRLDAGGGSYTNYDGLITNGEFMNSYRYWIQLVSGLMDVSNFSNTNWDFVGSILDMQNASTITSTVFNGGEAYSTNSYATSNTTNDFNINTSTTTNSLVITGIHATFSLGSIFWDATGAMQRLVFTGNQMSFFGRSTTSGSYYGVGTSGGAHSTETITGNTFYCNRTGTSHTVSGILETRSSGEATISGNSFDACTRPMLISGGGGVVTIDGNTAGGSSGAAVDDASSSSLLVTAGKNNFDILPSWRAPTISACGTGSPTATAGSNNTDGTVVVGGGTVTSCSISYTATLPYTPRSIVVTSNSTSAGTLAVTSSSTSGFSISTSATSINGVTLNWHVEQ